MLISGAEKRVTFAGGTRGRRVDWYIVLGREGVEGRLGNICGQGRGGGQKGRVTLEGSRAV